MTATRRGIGQVFLALAASALLANCGGGGGGGGNVIVRLFFGMNNDSACTNLIVNVDLAAAGAELDEDGGDPDCAMNNALDNAGCDASFDVLQNDTVLRVTISGCTIPAVTNLFQCGFRDVDLSELRDEANAQCSCANAGCDTTPPICISTSVDPGSCEDCDNGRDDDDNDLVDCDDPNCQYSPVCEFSTTLPSTSTTLMTTSTTQTTLTTGTTTTTTLSGGFDCTLTYRLADDVTVGSLQWETDYSGANGVMRGTGSQVECSSLASGALAAFQDDDAEKELSSGLVSLSGIDGPANLAVCKFDADSKPAVSDFDITVTEASTPDLVPITPLPDVVLDELECVFVGTTTLSTTTLPGQTTTTVVGQTTTTIPGGTTTTTLPGATGVNVGLVTASAPIGALQFTIDYSGVDGEFTGSGAAVACTSKVEGSLFAPNDNEGTRKLTLGIIALDAFSAPADLVNCEFVADDPENPPSEQDFTITIDDATDAQGQPVTATLDLDLNLP